MTSEPPEPIFTDPFMAGFESSSHRRKDGRRLDLIASTKHDVFALEDYQRCAQLRLPQRPEFVFGRKDLLAELHALLTGHHRDGPEIVALCGPSGAGKTSVAVEYAHRHLAEYGVVWQLPAAEPAALAAGLSELAGQLDGRGDPNAGDPRARVSAALAGRDDWLLIFDNAADTFIKVLSVR